jgi:tetrahedral aminopeptidase
VQEEIGLRGARVAAYALDPDLAIAIDSTPANDLPATMQSDGVLAENYTYNTRLGLGPAIYLADAGTLGDPRLARHLMQTGDRHQHPLPDPPAGRRAAPMPGPSTGARRGASISHLGAGRYAAHRRILARRADWENTLRWSGTPWRAWSAAFRRGTIIAKHLLSCSNDRARHARKPTISSGEMEHS